MKKLLVAVALALSAAACSPGAGSEWQKSYGKTFYEPTEGMAALYIIRDDPGSDPSPIGITKDRYPVGSLAGLTWMRLDLPPSLYDLRAYGVQGSTELVVTVNAGESRFLLAEPKPTGNAQLREISQVTGRQLVRKGQLVYSTP
ncbi:MAG: hypothetical protein EPO55_15945 [Reyranella sp.]|uniref:hypothetical protein n=1 Tax=Reyranella sp. TaxID=1929291 RepID=UPI001200BD2D|nr:hypothetical protein [Reyranella sp.]TAJ38354.1 MAG: hypothetical protein EPO55_15945 [Reyranella sp.]